MNPLYWLASYPKSGNTWLRIFLTNYWRNANSPANINQLEPTPVAASRPLFERYTGLDSTELTDDEIDCLRPIVYRQLATSYTDLSGPPVHDAPESDQAHRAPVFLKVHDAYQTLPNGELLFPAEVTGGVIYLIRNPLDVAPSFAAHMGCDIDCAIAAMNSPHFALCKPDGLATQLRQRLLSWGGHVNSWSGAADTVPCCVIRYEDMHAQPEETFGHVLRFLNEPVDQERLRKAIAYAAFNRLQEQEQACGFNEKPGYTKHFFRKGKPGSWQQELTPTQVDALVNQHRTIMEQWNYKVPC